MALILNKTINSIEYNYWVVEAHVDKHNKLIYFIMLLYSSENARKKLNQSPVYREKFPIVSHTTGMLESEMYAFVKQSIKKTIITEENGKSVIIEEEENPFANAIDARESDEIEKEIVKRQEYSSKENIDILIALKESIKSIK
jgi:D-serine dehydratase